MQFVNDSRVSYLKNVVMFTNSLFVGLFPLAYDRNFTLGF